MQLVDLSIKRAEKVLDIRSVLQVHHMVKTMFRLKFSKE
jgi:hypothetical protein